MDSVLASGYPSDAMKSLWTDKCWTRWWAKACPLRLNSCLVESFVLLEPPVCDVTIMLPVLHFLWQNRPLDITAPGRLTAGECSSECIHAERMDGILEASFRRPLHCTQRKVYIYRQKKQGWTCFLNFWVQFCDAAEVFSKARIVHKEI
jgi:hypothetical protein